jgi:hypothetical protein
MSFSTSRIITKPGMNVRWRHVTALYHLSIGDREERTRLRWCANCAGIVHLSLSAHRGAISKPVS